MSVLVFVHELGHFMTARRFGVGVEEFGFGLPPRIFGVQIFKDKIEKNGVIKIKRRWKLVGGRYKSVDGEPVIYSLNWIIVGGFVKIKGEDGGDVKDQNSFVNKPIWKRCLILAAGVIMNVILCMVLLSIGFGIGMPASVEGQPKGAIVTDGKIQIMEVLDSGPSKLAGLKPGDVMESIDGKVFFTIDALKNYIATKEGQIVNVGVVRQGKQINNSVKIENQKMGVGLVETATVRYPWHLAIWMGIKTTFIWIYAIVIAFVSIIKNLIIGVSLGVELAGPVGIAVMTGQAAKMGLVYVLQFAALLSINLAIINILPFPALDGGRIMFLLIEKVRRKAIKQELENLAHNIGFILLMILVVAVTYKDMVRYGGKMLGALKHVIGL